jgi:hypothetical protein
MWTAIKAGLITARKIDLDSGTLGRVSRPSPAPALAAQASAVGESRNVSRRLRPKSAPKSGEMHPNHPDNARQIPPKLPDNSAEMEIEPNNSKDLQPEPRAHSTLLTEGRTNSPFKGELVSPPREASKNDPGALPAFLDRRPKPPDPRLEEAVAVAGGWGPYRERVIDRLGLALKNPAAGKAAFDAWLANTVITSTDTGYVIEAPKRFAADHIDKKLRINISHALGGAHIDVRERAVQ